MNNENKEVIDKIEKSVENVVVPDELFPENVEKKLLGQDNAKDNTVDFNNAVKKKKMIKKMTAVAAAFAVATTSAYVGKNYIDRKNDTNVDNDDKVDDNTNVYDNERLLDASDDKTEAEDTKIIHSEFDGDMFTKAKNYDEVISLIQSNKGFISNTDDLEMDGAINNSSGEAYDSPTFGDNNVNGNVDNEREDTTNKDFSSTNTMVDGIDESDIVKTDGKYIYAVQGRYVYIVKASNGKLEAVSSVRIDSLKTRINEMYVDDNKLVLIGTQRIKKESKAPQYDGLIDYVYGVTHNRLMEYQPINFDEKTFMYTYDLSNIDEPKLEGTITMDGEYKTSRKVGNYVYMFTDNYVCDNYKKEFPSINGKKIGEDCIYYGKDLTNQQMCASINLENPSEVVDELLLFDSSCEIYFSNDAFYFYSAVYSWDDNEDEQKTQIGKFTYKDGKFDAGSSILIKGTIDDSFAISENDGYLRVLTTSWYWGTNSEKDFDRDNSLYVLDSNMKTVGTIDSIAPNENIYAARYVGNLVYFITYRNTDPLFIADLSDPTAPKLVGEASVSGFSDYLHMYSENLCLGIGEERDEEDSSFEGIKLCMFDVLDPQNPKVLDELVESDIYYTDAAYNYKSVLINSEKNVIGMAMTGYDEDSYTLYKVYGWEDGKFVEYLSYDMKSQDGKDENVDDVRGLFIGSSLYVVNDEGITSFDMNQKYKKQTQLSFDTTLNGKSIESQAVIASKADTKKELTIFENEDDFNKFIEDNKELKELDALKKFAQKVDFENENFVIDIEDITRYKYWIEDDYYNEVYDELEVNNTEVNDKDADDKDINDKKSNDESDDKNELSITTKGSYVEEGILYHDYSLNDGIEDGDYQYNSIFADDDSTIVAIFMDRMPKNVLIME